MKFKFTGRYTGTAETINACGITFTGREAAEVIDEEAIRRLSNHPEFQKVGGAPKKVASE